MYLFGGLCAADLELAALEFLELAALDSLELAALEFLELAALAFVELAAKCAVVAGVTVVEAARTIYGEML